MLIYLDPYRPTRHNLTEAALEWVRLDQEIKLSDSHGWRADAALSRMKQADLFNDLPFEHMVFENYMRQTDGRVEFPGHFPDWVEKVLDLFAA